MTPMVSQPELALSDQNQEQLQVCDSDLTLDEMVISKARAAFGSLVGQTVTRVSIEGWAMRVKCDRAELAMEGMWKLIDQDGATRDQAKALSSRNSFDLWQLVAKSVVSANL